MSILETDKIRGTSIGLLPESSTNVECQSLRTYQRSSCSNFGVLKGVYAHETSCHAPLGMTKPGDDLFSFFSIAILKHPKKITELFFPRKTWKMFGILTFSVTIKKRTPQLLGCVHDRPRTVSCPRSRNLGQTRDGE